MATIIPSVPITPDPAASLSGESKALLALKSLPDDYRVYHRKTWYSFDGGVREGEADLLPLHPELGMLVLEVKGGRVAFDGRWGRGRPRGATGRCTRSRTRSPMRAEHRPWPRRPPR